MMNGWLPFKMMRAARVSFVYPREMLFTTAERDVHVPCDGPSCKLCTFLAKTASAEADAKKIVVDSLRASDSDEPAIDERIARHFPITLVRVDGNSYRSVQR